MEATDAQQPGQASPNSETYNISPERQALLDQYKAQVSETWEKIQRSPKLDFAQALEAFNTAAGFDTEFFKKEFDEKKGFDKQAEMARIFAMFSVGTAVGAQETQNEGGVVGRVVAKAKNLWETAKDKLGKRGQKPVWDDTMQTDKQWAEEMFKTEFKPKITLPSSTPKP